MPECNEYFCILHRSSINSFPGKPNFSFGFAENKVHGWLVILENIYTQKTILEAHSYISFGRKKVWKVIYCIKQCKKKDNYWTHWVNFDSFDRILARNLDVL